ncbi:MAG: type II toxin-antitoxin system HicA family toxin [Kofleriaceae bacterium]|nr:type II toxin-antitoxin system HicA family toxin [Candidatus Methylomirabilis lanthanidiphila]
MRIRGKELIAALRRAGFQVIRVKGGHHYLSHPDSRVTVIPVHAGETLSHRAVHEDGHNFIIFSST